MPFSYVPGENDIRTTDTDGTASLIAAARAAGVSQFVYTSFSRNLDDPFPLRDAKRATETILRTSGMRYTILRPSCFMEVWLTPAVGFDAASAKVTVYGTGEAGISYIAVPDVATFAVHSLDTPAAWNVALELGGPAAVSQAEAVRLFERVAGRSFEVTRVPVDALAAQYEAATDPMQQSFAGSCGVSPAATRSTWPGRCRRSRCASPAWRVTPSGYSARCRRTPDEYRGGLGVGFPGHREPGPHVCAADRHVASEPQPTARRIDTRMIGRPSRA